MEKEQFWLIQDNKDIFQIILELRQKQFEMIKKEWGYSTVKLKEYLNDDPSTKHIKGYAEQYEGINITYLLPYTKKPIYYGRYAMWRLRLAVEAKAVIMIANGDLNGSKGYIAYINECLHLFLRVDSLQFKKLLVNYRKDEQYHEYLWFSDLVNNSYTRAIQTKANKLNWQQYVNFLKERSEYYKPKRKQKIYHYQFEDFEEIRKFPSFKEAHIYWSENIWPTLLDKFKEKKIEQFKQDLKKWNTFMTLDYDHFSKFNGYEFDKYQEVIDEYRESLNSIEIKKLTYRQFIKTIRTLCKKRYD